MLNLVLGKPTIRGLGKNSQKMLMLKESVFLERKLLDCFVLICTIKGNEAGWSLCVWDTPRNGTA